jgi:hypothetical protein
MLLYYLSLQRKDGLCIKKNKIIYNLNNKKYIWEIKQPWLELAPGNPNIIIKKDIKSYDIGNISVLNALNINKINPEYLFLGLEDRIKTFTQITGNYYELKDKEGEYNAKWLNTFFSEPTITRYRKYDDKRQILVFTSMDEFYYEEYGIVNDVFDVYNSIKFNDSRIPVRIKNIYFSYSEDKIVIILKDNDLELRFKNELKGKPIIVKYDYDE